MGPFLVSDVLELTPQTAREDNAFSSPWPGLPCSKVLTPPPLSEVPPFDRRRASTRIPISFTVKDIGLRVGEPQFLHPSPETLNPKPFT